MLRRRPFLGRRVACSRWVTGRAFLPRGTREGRCAEIDQLTCQAWPGRTSTGGLIATGAPPRPHDKAPRGLLRVPLIERFTARVPLDEHVRVDDAHPRMRMVARDARRCGIP